MDITDDDEDNNDNESYYNLKENQYYDFFLELHNITIPLMLCGNITKLKSLMFIPRPTPPPTRLFGSWVCPCLACGTIMVSQWSNWLTGPLTRDPPVLVTFNLDLGMTSEEQMSYELADCGVPAMNKSTRTFSESESSSSCLVCQSALKLHLGEVLYYGLVPVFLSPTKGESIPLFFHEPDHWKIPQISRDEQIKLILSRIDLESIGDVEYKKCTLPVLPALDISYSVSRTSSQRSGIPLELFTKPLIKRKKSEAFIWPSSLTGIASGRRSALVKLKGKWYRLKGCGDLEDGFPVAFNGDNGEKSVRGCLFEHTVSRELYMATKVEEALKKSGIGCSAILPIGWYKYESCTDWILPKVIRYCGVYETIGDRRLGDHLIAGLEIILPLICDSSQSIALSHAISKSRQVDLNEELWETSMVVETDMKIASDLIEFSLKEFSPLAYSSLSEYHQKIIPNEMKLLWDDLQASLTNKIEIAKEKSGIKSLLLYLAWRLGWECGKILRCFHDSDISWGTYPDQLGIHCNAHINNLVIKTPQILVDENKYDTYLSPLDFDMAFTKEQYISEIVEESKQKLFPRDWLGLLNWEKNMGFKTSLAGSTFANTGVSNQSQNIPKEFIPMQIAFRDTIVAGFEASYNNLEDRAPFSPIAHDAVCDIVRMALITTMNVIA
eukprot:c21618_g2_i1.p1 GENE.c21618_g2_i1~~c21618_g2_i1.p1  ORF type:complete len:755 (-),score=269.09 c21618_g2_i1:58-2058(-)